MRLIVFLIYYVLLNSLSFASTSTSNTNSIQNKYKIDTLTQTLSTEPWRDLFFETSLSEKEKQNLKQFLQRLPLQLLNADLADDETELQMYSEDHFVILSAAQQFDSHRKILHYLLHQLDDRNKISSSKQWQKFSGWKRAWYGFLMVANNSDSRAYAEAYGSRNPAEDFNAAADHFILTPTSTLERSIKCRIPMKYNFVKSLFPEYNSALEQDFVVCRGKSEGILDDVVFSDPDTGKVVNLGPVNEHTVTGFELLYATPGTGDASEIAGHLLLRIKLNNNPQATALGIENPNDLVVSFLANTTAKQQPQENKVTVVQSECKKNWFDSGRSSQSNFEALRAIGQSLKGLSGGFLTLMDRQPLSQAIKNYTIEEDRDLLRYKLELNTEQTHRLLEQLYRAKKNYNAKYFFFNQNCASVLVKVIGLGIQSSTIANFNPIVSPPNSLVALFIREGLAKPIRPAFYSYRKKAYLAQDLIADYYQELTADYARMSWPNIKPLFTSSSKNRLTVIKEIGNNIGQQASLDVRLNRFFVLVQEAEMVYEHKDLDCEQYTSNVTAQAREYQRRIMLASNASVTTVSTDNLLSDYYKNTADNAYAQGVPHTKLLAYGIGTGYYSNSKQNSNAIVSFNITLDEQQLGSISNIAMQRSSYVKLASSQINFGVNNNQENSILSWRFTALEVRKFKDRLNRVPSYFSPAGSIGLGLSLLDVEIDNVLRIEHGTWFGGELLFNILSSAEHNNYIYTSIGADLRYHKTPDDSNTRVVLPARLETLITFDQKRHWQWRNNIEYRYAIDNDFEHEYEFNSGLTYQMGEIVGRLILFRVSSEYKYFGKGNSSHTSWLGIEINPY